MAEPDPLLGRQLLGGQFRIIERLGSGGMSVVYTALQPGMQRKVAVKVLHPHFSARKDLAARLRREARVMSQLSHPSIAKVFVHGELDDGSLYFVMELLEGRTLKQAIVADGTFPLERALPIFLAICGAVGEAHEAGVVHRDLKPDNIFLCHSGALSDFPKVLDFGLAKVPPSHRPGSIALTGDNEIFGTPRYMSPEQAQGKPLTLASDLYSLGLILYEMLVGKSPFNARTPIEYSGLHIQAAPIPLNRRVPGLTFPEALEQIIMKTLEKRPEDRPATAVVFAEGLHAILEQSGLATAPAAPGISAASLSVRPVAPRSSDALRVARAGRGTAALLIAAAFFLGVALTVVVTLLLRR